MNTAQFVLKGSRMGSFIDLVFFAALDNIMAILGFGALGSLGPGSTGRSRVHWVSKDSKD
jgi:hypothetical protein